MKEKEVQEEQAKLEQQAKSRKGKTEKRKKAVHKKKKAKKKSHKTKRTRKSRQKSVPDENIKNNAITTCLWGIRGARHPVDVCYARTEAERRRVPLQDMCMDVSTSCVSCKA